ncbi:hypothetical protein [Corallococcus soli]|nr:hypothetical protein [Corallococcus soli]
MPANPTLLPGEGLLELPLLSTTTAGRSYKLVGATFVITGPQSVTLTDTTVDSVSTPLMAGLYSIQMTGPWHVERTDAPGQTVPATLVSPNPMSFTLGEGETRPVRFLFKVEGDGTADVGFRVDHGGWISGSITFDPLAPGESEIFAELAGTTVPFVISYESAVVDRSWGMVSVETSPITAQFGGASELLLKQLVPSMNGNSMHLQLYRTQPGGVMYLPFIELGAPGAPARLQLELGVLSVINDADGYPVLQPYSMQGVARVVARENSGDGYLQGVVNGQFSPQ